MNKEDLLKFANIIKSPISPGTPFTDIYNNNSSYDSINPLYNIFPIIKIVRCPICLGHVIGGKRPNKCYHIYCSYCIKKWALIYLSKIDNI